MTRWLRLRGSVWWLAVALAVLVAGATGTLAQAGELKNLDISLKWIPDDAAFYSVMLRNREQLDLVRGSKAFAKLMDMPVVKEAFKKFDEEADKPNSPAAKFKDGMNNPMVQDILGLIGDMLSHDMFIYGNQTLVDDLELMQKLNGAQQYGQVFGELGKKPDGLTKEQYQAQLMIHILASDVDKIRIPGVVSGFKVKNTARAKEHLDNLRGMIALAGMSVPELKDCCKQTTVCGHDYITIILKGEQIPWDKVPLDDVRKLEMEKGEVDKIVDHVKQMTLVIAFGLRDDYLLVSVGESTEELARMGSSKLLLDRPELKPLEKFADKRLTSISYVSQAMNAHLATTKEDLDELVNSVDELLAPLELSTEQKAEITNDAKALAEDLKPLIPEPGAAMAFSFLTDDGIESYSYDWSKGKECDPSKPLSLLEHVGGAPLLAAVSRGGNSREDYDLLAKWAKVGYRYFEKYALPRMESHKREEFQKCADTYGPLVKRWDEITREKLLPSLGNESGVVLEAKLQLQKIATGCPELEKPMPVPEGAIVVVISDKDKFTDAMEQYRQLINDALAKVRELQPHETPEVQVSPAASTNLSCGGTLYYCPLPSGLGIDERIAPSVAVSAKVAVLSLSREQAGRLLDSTKLDVGGALAEPDKARAAAFVFQWSALVDAARPWIDYGAEKAIQRKHLDEEEAKEARQEIDTTVNLLKVFRSLTCESYREDGALVGHQVAVFRDLE